jgi:hypothetical protein
MKKYIVLFVVICLAFSSMAQNFKGNFSGMIGIPNVKVRIQYEHPISPRSSVGFNANYHFFNWKGPMAETFGRVYSKKFGNEKGFFGQMKMCYGNFTYLNSQSFQTTKRFSVYGAGIGCGYKFLVAPHFTIEPYGGLRIISGPSASNINSSSSWLEDVGWYFWTGFPFELHAKLGYQF